MATEKKFEAKHELKNIELFEEKGQYYLKLKYIIEDERRIKELEFPKVGIPFNKNVYPNVDTHWSYANRSCSLRAGCYGVESLPILPGETSEANHVYYTEKTIKEKQTEMTIAEIEKKLGYKIKIVAEE